jgi:hypothetical protein
LATGSSVTFPSAVSGRVGSYPLSISIATSKFARAFNEQLVPLLIATIAVSEVADRSTARLR